MSIKKSFIRSTMSKLILLFPSFCCFSKEQLSSSSFYSRLAFLESVGLSTFVSKADNFMCSSDKVRWMLCSWELGRPRNHISQDIRAVV